MAPGPTSHNPDPDTTPTERRHYPTTRRTITLITAILLTLTPTIPAWAGGWINCQAGGIVRTVGYGVYAPGHWHMVDGNTVYPPYYGPGTYTVLWSGSGTAPWDVGGPIRSEAAHCVT